MVHRIIGICLAVEAQQVVLVVAEVNVVEPVSQVIVVADVDAAHIIRTAIRASVRTAAETDMLLEVLDRSAVRTYRRM